MFINQDTRRESVEKLELANLPATFKVQFTHKGHGMPPAYLWRQRLTGAKTAAIYETLAAAESAMQAWLDAGERSSFWAGSVVTVDEVAA